jgi:hypothetical protein
MRLRNETNMNVYDLLVRQVSSLVTVTAEEIVKQTGKST